MSKPWIQTIRRENGLIEHICKCGVGHPAFGSVHWQSLTGAISSNGVHGCCGCCSTPEWKIADAREGVKVANQIILDYKNFIKKLSAPPVLAYKLLRVRADGSLGSLFCNAPARLPLHEWMDAGLHPTGKLKVRCGWHALTACYAPHLSKKGRAWFRVLLHGDIEKIERPQSQGGQWLIAQKMMIINKA